jgi:hypothetical protein
MDVTAVVADPALTGSIRPIKVEECVELGLTLVETIVTTDQALENSAGHFDCFGFRLFL